MPDTNPEADPESASASANPGVFATTHWSVVLAAGQGNSSEGSVSWFNATN